MEKVTVVNHPLVQHKLTIMRQAETNSFMFRTLMNEVSKLLAYEVTRNLETSLVEITTPLAKMMAPTVDCSIVLVSILRAGNGFLDGMLDLIPNARVGHIGLYRDPKTLEAIEYYFKMPPQLHEGDVIIVDPMLATGHSAVAAISRIRSNKPKSIRFVSLVSSPEGIKVLSEAHPDVLIYTAAIDDKLDEHGYIVPGLGDAGDRIFGTK
ncbi:MAG: uracil phosphoribosyltransferase [Oligoflexus sp.]